MPRRLGRGLLSAALLATAIGVATPIISHASCVGDCSGDGRVAVAELVVGVNVALGLSSVAACPAIDADSDGQVGVPELVVAVETALKGCERRPTPSPIETPPGTPVPASPTPTMDLDSVCHTVEGSLLRIHLPLLGEPLPFPLSDGQLLVQCDDSAEGDTVRCRCSLLETLAAEFPGFGEVCVTPKEACSWRDASCSDTGQSTGGEVHIVADRNIGECDSPVDCAEMCDSRCASIGTGLVRKQSACEKFCAGGSAEPVPCTLDADCDSGVCHGQDNLDHGQICQCACWGEEPRAVGLRCQLGLEVSIHGGSEGRCDNYLQEFNNDYCLEMTASEATGQFLNVHNSAELEVEPVTLTGKDIGCDKIRARNFEGLELVGHTLGFATGHGFMVSGDLLSDLRLVCGAP